MTITKRKRITKEMKKAVWEKTGGRCWYCGFMTVSRGIGNYREEPNIDHQQPCSRGGETRIENLVLACAQCNMEKRLSNVDEFREVVRDGDPRYATERLIEGIDSVGNWERGEIHDEMQIRLRGFLEYLRSRTIAFYGETLEMKQSDYCI